MRPAQAKTTSRSWPTSLLVSCLFLLVLVGCGDGDETSTTTTTATTEATTTASTSTSGQPTTASTAAPTTSSTAASTSTTASTASQTTSTEPSIAITYRCGDGDTGSADIPTDDIEQIDDIVNTIDFCEFKGGLVEISFTAPCPSGDRDVTVPTDEGAVPDIATLDLCENP